MPSGEYFKICIGAVSGLSYHKHVRIVAPQETSSSVITGELESLRLVDILKMLMELGLEPLGEINGERELCNIRTRRECFFNQGKKRLEFVGGAASHGKTESAENLVYP